MLKKMARDKELTWKIARAITVVMWVMFAYTEWLWLTGGGGWELVPFVAFFAIGCGATWGVARTTFQGWRKRREMHRELSRPPRTAGMVGDVQLRTDDELKRLSPMMWTITRGVRAISEDWKSPDAQYEPYVFGVTANDEPFVLPVGEFFSPQAIEGMPDELREQLGDDDQALRVMKRMFFEEILPTIVETQGLKEVGVLTETWRVHHEPGEEITLPPSEHPDRVRNLCLQRVTPRGTQVWMLDIGEDPLGQEPPTLAETWMEVNTAQELDGSDQADLRVNVMRKTLAAVRTVHLTRRSGD